MNSKMRSSVMGLILGQFSSPLPEVQKEPVAYLYNGVRLPALPEWDKEKYPFAAITTDETYQYRLWLSSVGFECFDTWGGFTNVVSQETVGISVQYGLSSDSWSKVETTDGAGHILSGNNDRITIWSSVDIYYTQAGTLYLAASDPIPVYE